MKIQTGICSPKRTAGFSRTELFVTIGVVAVLVALAGLLVVQLKERALRTKCQANVKKLTAGLRQYAGDHSGLLPDCTENNPKFNGPQWPWEMHTNLVTALGVYGLTRDTYYCPANPAMNDDRHWLFAESFRAPSRVTGYMFLLNGTLFVPPNYARVDLRGDGKRPASECELMGDIVASMGGSYTEIRGFLKDRSSHMKGEKPSGGNIGYLDGHVDWRPFSKMTHKIRYFVVWDF